MSHAPSLSLPVQVLRRAQWNLYRIENEHLSNCGKFRAVDEVPLPFSHDHLEEADRSFGPVIDEQEGEMRDESVTTPLPTSDSSGDERGKLSLIAENLKVTHYI